MKNREYLKSLFVPKNRLEGREVKLCISAGKEKSGIYIDGVKAEGKDLEEARKLFDADSKAGNIKITYSQ